MKKILLLKFALILFSTNYLLAQVTTNFNNENVISDRGQFQKNYRQTIDFAIAPKSIDSLLLNERQVLTQSNEVKPFKLAVPINVNLDISKLLNWTYDKHFAYGKFTINLSGALSASISFDKFYLPEKTELFIYNENGKMITGPVTEKENNPNRIWGSWVYQGALLTIEIKTPIASINDLILHSNNVAYGYKEIYKSIKVGGFGQSGPCNINVICPLGSGWEGERNSVSTILSSNGGEFCSGALIMNTCGTNAPYYLTANHCFDGNTLGWRFAFQAWSTTCPNPGVNTNGVMYNGATLRARNAPTDFCLVELNQTPPAISGLHYSGWTRSATPAQNATAIHHPRGDLMKISRANNPVTVSSFNGTTNQHWRTNWSTQNNGSGQTVTAVTEPGSSGSPLFDPNHRIIGQLHGGPSECGGASLWDFYGRFDLSWTGGGTNATRLSNWLDPNNSNAIETNTTSIANLFPNVNFTIGGADYICTNETYIVNNLPATNVSVSWQILQAGSIVSSTISGNSITINKIANGTIELQATITNLCNSTTKVVSKNLIVGTGTTAKFWLHGQSFDYTATGPGNYYSVCPNEYLWFEPYYGNSGNPATAHIWTISGSYTLLSGLDGSTLSVQAPPNVNDAFSISYQYLSVCGGWSDIAYGGAGVMNCAGGEEPYRVGIKPKVKELNIRGNASIYPNPASTVLVVEIPQDNPKGQLKIVDMNGKQVYQTNINSKRQIVNVSSITNGVYLLKLIINGKEETTKIIINK